MTKEQTVKTKKTFRGVVVSDLMDKTVVVKVMRYVKHPVYGKFVKITSRFKAHDADNQYKIGDQVLIEECRPISKQKSFIVTGTY